MNAYEIVKNQMDFLTENVKKTFRKIPVNYEEGMCIECHKIPINNARNEKCEECKMQEVEEEKDRMIENETDRIIEEEKEDNETNQNEISL